MEKPTAALSPVILIVEDESILRLNAIAFIEEAGFQVIEAANADVAIEILAHRADIRIVFTDIQMPGSMDGLKLAAFVRNRWPPIELIITSARSMRDIDLPDRGIFLPKPYVPAKVIELLHHLAA